eukprot:Phypoly_transcript_01779.p1 GENE.Phypoly_transcript_01779~~Phypoly_transcript_01779.p1  ORF type:complete len:1029 (-),score=194.94 Phypoly_transcript_01779:18-3104(-)
MTSLQDIKTLVAWAGPHPPGTLPPSSSLPSILSLLDSAPACHETVFHALQIFLTAVLSKLFQGNIPNKQHFAQRYAGGGAGGRERESDTNSLHEDVRVISSHLLGVLQKNSTQWAPVITKWIFDILRSAELTLPRSASTVVENIPLLETLLAHRLKHPALKNLSSLLSSAWLFLDLFTCTQFLDELLAGAEKKEEGTAGGKKGGDVDWVLALVGIQDPERTILVALRHLSLFYVSLNHHNVWQPLALHRAGKLLEFISYRFPVHASAAILLFLDDQLFPSSHPPVLPNWEDKVGFLACAGSAFPKLFDAAFGAVLERVESFSDTATVFPRISHHHTRTLLETLLSERLLNIATSSHLPRIFSVLQAISSNPTQGMDTDNGIPMHSLAHALLTHILHTVTEISFVSGSKTNEPVLWGVVGQWRIFWDLGELGQASVLASLLGLDRASQAATAHNVHAIAGAVLAHALVKTEPDFSPSKSGHDPYPTLVAVLNVFNPQPSLLARALDSVLEQIAPNPQLCCVLLSRFVDFISFSNHSPAFSILAINISMHWQKILSFTTHPHQPLRLCALFLLRSILPILYSQLTRAQTPRAQHSHAQNPTQNQLVKSLPFPATHIFHPKSVLKIKTDAAAFQNIIRTLANTLLTCLKKDKHETLDFEYIESIMNTLAIASSLSPIHFGLVVTLLLEFIFSSQATNVIREPISTPLPPTNCLPRPPQTEDNNMEKKRLLEMNYTRHWRAQIHNRLGSGVFIPKRQRLADSDAPRGFPTISVRNNNIHNDLDDGVKLNGHVTIDPDLELYGGDALALRRGAVVSLLGRCVAQQPISYFATLTDQYLVHLSTQAPVPTYEQYAEVLPKISPFERDIFLRKVFKQNPILLDILELIADEPLEFIKLFEVIKGILANTIAHWNAEPGSSTLSNPHFNFTVRFITMLGKAQWIPHPLSCCGEIMNVMTPSELSMLLITMWNFVRDFPPVPDSYSVSKSGKPRRIFASQAKLSVFIRPMRTIAHAHIVELGALYRAYFEPREIGAQ